MGLGTVGSWGTSDGVLVCIDMFGASPCTSTLGLSMLYLYEDQLNAEGGNLVHAWAGGERGTAN